MGLVMASSNNHGGQRDGAGRPAKPEEEKNKSTQIRVPDEILPTVRELIEEYKSSKNND